MSDFGCQALRNDGGPCKLRSRHVVAGVDLCDRHRDVLGRRGGLTIRRFAQGPAEAMVNMASPASAEPAYLFYDEPDRATG